MEENNLKISFALYIRLEFSNIILIANFVTAYLFISNTFIKYTFIKYQYLFNDNKKYLQHKMLNALSYISP